MSHHPHPGSRRIPWPGEENSLALLHASLKRSGARIIDLTVNNPATAALGQWDKELAAAFGEISDFTYRPDPRGLATAREAIAGHYSRSGCNIDPDSLFLTASSSESYSFLFQALCDPGDEVLSPLPSYPLFEYLAGLAAVKLLPYRLRYQGEWQVDFSSLEERISPRTRAVVVVNPNNPTGSFLRDFERDRLMRLCSEKGIVLIADEVFSEFPLHPPADRASFAGARNDALTVSLGGLSKCAGLPQMKLGWMLLGGPAQETARLLDRLQLIGDTFLSVSTPAQAALPALLRVGAEIRLAIQTRLRANLARLESCVEIAPLLTLPRVEGGWSAALRLPATRPDAEWCEALLLERRVLTQPGYFFEFDGDAWLVVSLLTPETDFAEGLACISALVQTELCRERFGATVRSD